MIEVCVREQHEIDWRKLGKGQCWFGEPFRANSEKWQANSDAWKQNGVG